MNSRDALSILILLPYLTSLYILPGIYSLTLSLLTLLILLNIYFLARAGNRGSPKPFWLLPLSFTILYSLSTILSINFPDVFYLSLASLLLIFFGGGLEEAPHDSTIYLGVVISATALALILRLGSLLFYIATPLIDFLWLEGFSGQRYLDKALTLAPLILVYLVIAPQFFLYVFFFGVLRLPFLGGRFRYFLLYIDYFLRILLGWFLGLGY